MSDKQVLMVTEAVKIMRLLEFDPKMIFDFAQDGKIYMTVEGQKPQEIGESEQALIAEFEKGGRYKVYHVVSGGVNGIGYCKNLLFVAQYESDYPVLEYQAIRRCAMAYAHNETYPECSETGFVSLAAVPYFVRIG